MMKSPWRESHENFDSSPCPSSPIVVQQIRSLLPPSPTGNISFAERERDMYDEGTSMLELLESMKEFCPKEYKQCIYALFRKEIERPSPTYLEALPGLNSSA